MVAAYHGREYKLAFLQKKCRLKKRGVSMLDIYKAAKTIGFHCLGVKMGIGRLKEVVQSAPLILHCDDHFVVLYKTSKSGKNSIYHIADPTKGPVTFREKDFRQYWGNKRAKTNPVVRTRNNSSTGYALILTPTTTFYK